MSSALWCFSGWESAMSPGNGSSDAVGLGVVVFAMCIGQEKMATRPEPMKEAVVTCLSWACWLWGLVLSFQCIFSDG